MVRGITQISSKALDAAVRRSTEPAFTFLERLVAERSVLGNERGAQEVLALELERLGFALDWLPIGPEVLAHPASGVPAIPYEGRRVLVGRRAGTHPDHGRSLLVNGHLDVVPTGGDALWTTPAWTPVRRDGWMHGRGAGDMKAGWAMTALALDALDGVGAELAGDLVVVGAIEEECGGNGTLASLLAGVTADAALLPEPTDLELLLGGVGVLWLDVELRGRPAHAEAMHAGVSAIEAVAPVLEALRRLSAAFEHDAPAGRRFHANVGTLQAGDWPSTVPGIARLRVRVGFPADTTALETAELVRAKIDDALGDRPVEAIIEPSGFRAEPYQLDARHPLVGAVSAAHAEVHGAAPATVTTNGTTDARFYLNQGDMPVLCYGPRTRNMHGADEAVELASVVAGGRVLARFIAAWTAGPVR